MFLPLMKKNIIILFFFLPLLLLAQEKEGINSYIQIETFYGNILKHNKNVGYFLTGHPTGLILSYNLKSKGDKDWQKRYNYPDFGFSAAYQDYKNTILGKLYSLYVHYNFYFLPRNNKNQLLFRTGWGITYNTNPYNKVTNPKNVAFGTKLNSSTYLKLYYQHENLIKNIGLNAGLTFIHASNSSVKSPNTGVNVWAATLGLNYNLSKETQKYDPKKPKEKYSEKLKYNFKFSFGANETDYIGSGVKPFYVVSAYVDKRIGKKSALQFGTEWMANYSLKEYIKIQNILDNDTTKKDFNRIGLLLGHELFISKVSLETQLGYYIYYPFDFEGRIYERVTIKYYFKEQKKYFATIGLKAHAAKAETVAFGIGIRL
jgi:hypothetical protein